MDDVLSAGSPVEIDAKAEAAGLAETDRDAALALFHDLTSRLELTLLETPADGGEPWPRHRFWFGPARLVDALVAQMRGLDGVEEAPADAPVIFVTGTDGKFAAVLAAGSQSDWLSRISID